MNYFIALDALLGRRGAVESSILSGLERLQLGPVQVEKSSWLFDLRNELVHGGSDSSRSGHAIQTTFATLTRTRWRMCSRSPRQQLCVLPACSSSASGGQENRNGRASISRPMRPPTDMDTWQAEPDIFCLAQNR